MIQSSCTRLQGCLRQIPLKTPGVTAFAATNMSTASTEAKPERISKNLSFRPAYDSHIDEPQRPVVLLYAWLGAKAKHIHKYGDFYMKKGFDVLHVKVSPSHVVWPIRAQSVVEQVMDFTLQDRNKSKPILLHGFSVGAYLWGETLVKMRAQPDLKNDFQERLQGQIMDSPVDFDRVPLGVSRVVTDIPILQALLKVFLEGYLRVFKNQTVTHFERSSNAFKENAFKSPTLFLYSKKDLITPHTAIEEVMTNMKLANIPVFSRCFQESVHVSHFHQYPVEYIASLTHFLQEMGLLTETPVQEKIVVGA